jgi:hypothetical protein
MKTGYGILLILIISAAAIGTIAFLAPRMSATLCHVPATRHALGARIVLESVKRTRDGHMQVKMTAVRKTDPKTSIRFDAVELLRPAINAESAKYAYNSPGVPPGTETGSIETSFPIAGRHGTVDISESVCLDTAKKRVMFRFNQMRPGRGQLIVLKGKAGVTIRSVEINQPVLDRKWTWTYRSTTHDVPPSAPQIKVELDTTFPFRYDDKTHDATLTDDRGRKYPVLQEFQNLNATTHLPNLTTAERVVGVFSKSRAYGMAFRRAARLSRGKPEWSVRMLTFPAIYPAPKYVTLEIPGTLPPDPKNVATLTFLNVPVGK